MRKDVKRVREFTFSWFHDALNFMGSTPRRGLTVCDLEKCKARVYGYTMCAISMGAVTCEEADGMQDQLRELEAARIRMGNVL